MTIAYWPLYERPREKLLARGTTYLSDAELIAIFLRTGTSGKTALDLARELLSECGSLKKLFAKSPSYFYEKRGLGKAKYAALKAAIELGKRYVEEEITLGEIVNNTQATKKFLHHRLKDYTHEVFACLFLNTHYQVIVFEELFHGTLNESVVYPREVVKRALAHNAAYVILAHNHPSGNPCPSQSDEDITIMLKKALALVNIDVIDHIIVGNRECFSLSEKIRFLV